MGAMTSTIHFELSEETNNALIAIAQKHKRSRRMEAIVAIETYLDSFELSNFYGRTEDEKETA